MKIKLLAAGLMLAGRAAFAGLPLGRGEVSATATATATYDSNVFGSADATADSSATLAPRLSYRRQAGRLEAEANAGVSVIRYLEQTQLDADNVDADVTLRTADDAFRHYTGSLFAGYREDSDVSPDINARINTKTATVLARSTLTTGPRSKVALDGTYSDVWRSLASDQRDLTAEAVYDYQDFFRGNSLRLTGEYEQFRSSGGNAFGVPLNQDSLMASAGLNRALLHDTLHAGLSYGYRILSRSRAETRTGTGRQAGSVVTASLDGPFLPEKYFPKVKSQFALSYEDAATPGVNDTGSKELTGLLSLAWAARDATDVLFSARRNQRLSVDDLTVVSTKLEIGVEQTLRYNLTGTVKAGYEWASYRPDNRRDRIASFTSELKYHFARTWDGSLSYVFTDTSSVLRQSTYDRHLASLSVTYRY